MYHTDSLDHEMTPVTVYTTFPIIHSLHYTLTTLYTHYIIHSQHYTLTTLYNTRVSIHDQLIIHNDKMAVSEHLQQCTTHFNVIFRWAWFCGHTLLVLLFRLYWAFVFCMGGCTLALMGLGLAATLWGWKKRVGDVCLSFISYIEDWASSILVVR
jgi:hypothetical protein